MIRSARETHSGNGSRGRIGVVCVFFGRKYTNETTCRTIGHLGLVHRLRATPQWPKKVRKSESHASRLPWDPSLPSVKYVRPDSRSLFRSIPRTEQSTKSSMPGVMNQHVCQTRELVPPSYARRIDLFDSRLQLVLADSACLHVKLAAASFSDSRSQKDSRRT